MHLKFNNTGSALSISNAYIREVIKKNGYLTVYGLQYKVYGIHDLKRILTTTKNVF